MLLRAGALSRASSTDNFLLLAWLLFVGQLPNALLQFAATTDRLIYRAKSLC